MAVFCYCSSFINLDNEPFCKIEGLGGRFRMSDFLNRMKGAVDKGVTAASVKFKESVEVVKLRTKLKNFSNEKNERILELGSIVYTLFKQGTLKDQGARIEEKCGAIQDLDRKIQETENEMERIHRESEEFLGRSQGDSSTLIKCECGAVLKKEAKFCAFCGKNVLELREQVEKEKALFQTCPKCGAKGINLDAKFCPQCGSSFSGVSQTG